LVINGNIVLTINCIVGGKVLIGIQAPRSVKVLRGEVPDSGEGEPGEFRYE